MPPAFLGSDLLRGLCQAAAGGILLPWEPILWGHLRDPARGDCLVPSPPSVPGSGVPTAQGSGTPHTALLRGRGCLCRWPWESTLQLHSWRSPHNPHGAFPRRRLIWCRGPCRSPDPSGRAAFPTTRSLWSPFPLSPHPRWRPSQAAREVTRCDLEGATCRPKPPPSWSLPWEVSQASDAIILLLRCEEYPGMPQTKGPLLRGCSQGPPKEGFVMGSRTQGVQKIFKNIGCPHPHKSELGDGMRGAGPLRAVLHSNRFADNL